MRARLGQIGKVLEDDTVGPDDVLFAPTESQNLVNRVDPPEPAAPVDLLHVCFFLHRAIGPPPPDESVLRASGVRVPARFQSVAPPGLENLVQVIGYANVDVVGNVVHRDVAGGVEAPRGEGRLVHECPSCAQFGDGRIGGPGVQHHDDVGLLHGVHPAVDELLLVLADGVDAHCVTTDGSPPRG